jgi:hypothetical protein
MVVAELIACVEGAGGDPARLNAYLQIEAHVGVALMLNDPFMRTMHVSGPQVAEVISGSASP